MNSNQLTPADIETLEYMARDDAQIEGSKDDFALCTTSRIIKVISEYSVERLRFGGCIKELDRLGTWVIYGITDTGRALVNSDGDDTEAIAPVAESPMVDQPSFPHDRLSPGQRNELLKYIREHGSGVCSVQFYRDMIGDWMRLKLARAAVDHILSQER